MTKKIIECYITLNNEHLIFINKKYNIEVWNLRGKVREKMMKLNNNSPCLTLRKKIEKGQPALLYLQKDAKSIILWDYINDREVKKF